MDNFSFAYYISIPSTVDYIGKGAFYDCYNLWDIYYAGTEIQFSDNITWNGRNNIGMAVEHFTDGTRHGDCSASGSNVKWELDDNGTLKISGVGVIKDYCTYGMNDLPPWIAYKTEISRLVISDGVNGVGTFAFNECYYIQYVTIPESITSISIAAFEECDNLLQVSYDGTKAQWDAIGIDPRNDELQVANIVCEKGTQVPSDVIETGKCGKSIRWSLHTNGVLSIYGSGEMDSYGPYWLDESAPWYEYRSKIVSIQINGDITNIGDYAFYGLEKLEEISMPDSISIFGSSSFSYCVSLKKILIPENVTSIGNQLFYGCMSLKQIDVSHGNRYYFSSEGVLFQRYLEEENDIYAGTWLYWYPAAKDGTTYTIPDDVVAIDGTAFMNCDNLETVIIPHSVNDISWDAFFECNNLKTVMILNPEIHLGTFFQYGPDDHATSHAVTYSAFCYCYSITDVFFAGNESEWYSATVGYWDREWDFSAWANTGFNEDVVIHFNYDQNILTSGYCGKIENSLPWTIYKDGTLKVDGNGEMANFGSFATTPWSSFAEAIKRIEIGEGVKSVGANAFTGCVGISEITIPNTVTTICAFAFSSCTGLRSVNLPYGVMDIGEHAFSFSGLTNIHLPLSLVRIDYAAFSFCNNLTNADYEGTKKQWRTVQIAEENQALLLVLPNTESRETKIGTLEFVNTVVVIDGQNYLVPSSYYSSLSDLLNNKKVPDKRVVYEVVDDEIESIYSIYEVVKVGIDFEILNNVSFHNGSFSSTSFSVTISASLVSPPGGSDEIMPYQLYSLGNDLSIHVNNMKLKSSRHYCNFGKGGIFGLKTLYDKEYDIDVDVSGYSKKTVIGTFDLCVDGSNILDVFKTDLLAEDYLICTLSPSKKGQYKFTNSTTISFSNLDMADKNAEEEKRDRVEYEKAEELQKALDDVKQYVLLDNYLYEFFSLKQIQDMERIIGIHVAEVIVAQDIETGNVLERLSARVRKHVKKKIFDKLGVPNVNSSRIECTLRIKAVTKSGDEKIVVFNIPVDLNNFNTQTYAAFAEISYNVQDTNLSGTGTLTYTNVGVFADQLMDYVKEVYKEAWGDDAGKIAEMFMSKNAKIMVNIVDALSDDPVGLLYILATKPASSVKSSPKPSKRVVVKCPVDVHVYCTDGELAGSIVNNNEVVTSSSGALCYVNGDNKILYLSNDDYKINVVGNDTGTMDYLVEEYLDGNLTRTVTTSDVPLSPGKSYTSIVPDVLFPDNIVYALTVEDEMDSENNKVILSVTSDVYQTDDSNTDDKCVITYLANNSTDAKRDVLVNKGAEITLEENNFIPPDGNQFKAWSIGGTEYQPGVKYTPQADTTIVAVWSGENEFSVSVNGGNVISPKSTNGTYEVNSRVTIRATIFGFKYWSGIDDLQIVEGNTNSETVTFIMPSKNVDAFAHGGCYVATAVYGSYDCPEVWTLRRYRDKVLAKTWYGHLFIHLYYAVSPTAVKLFGRTQWFQNFFRNMLDPWVADLQADGFESTPYNDMSW